MKKLTTLMMIAEECGPEAIDGEVDRIELAGDPGGQREQRGVDEDKEDPERHDQGGEGTHDQQRLQVGVEQPKNERHEEGAPPTFQVDAPHQLRRDPHGCSRDQPPDDESDELAFAALGTAIAADYDVIGHGASVTARASAPHQVWQAG